MMSQKTYTYILNLCRIRNGFVNIFRSTGVFVPLAVFTLQNKFMMRTRVLFCLFK